MIVTNRVGQSLKTITKPISSSCKVSFSALICAAESILIRGEFLLEQDLLLFFRFHLELTNLAE